MTEHATATALLDAAEQAFADDGIDAASLRAIMRQAGVDTGAVHYHFGSRADLVAAVLDRLLAPLQSRRLELLAAQGDAPTLAGLVDALVRPDLEVVLAVRDRNPDAGHVVATIYLRPSTFVRQQVEASFAPVAERFMPHLLARLPDVPGHEVSWRVRWVVFGTLGAWLAEAGRTFDATQLDLERDRLVASLAAALAGPASSTTESP